MLFKDWLRPSKIMTTKNIFEIYMCKKLLLDSMALRKNIYVFFSGIDSINFLNLSKPDDIFTFECIDKNEIVTYSPYMHCIFDVSNWRKKKWKLSEVIIKLMKLSHHMQNARTVHKIYTFDHIGIRHVCYAFT